MFCTALTDVSWPFLVFIFKRFSRNSECDARFLLESFYTFPPDYRIANCLTIYLFICQPTHLLIYLQIYPTTYRFTYISVYLFTYPLVHIFTYSSIYFYIRPQSLCPNVTSLAIFCGLSTLLYFHMAFFLPWPYCTKFYFFFSHPYSIELSYAKATQHSQWFITSCWTLELHACFCIYFFPITWALLKGFKTLIF